MPKFLESIYVPIYVIYHEDGNNNLLRNVNYLPDHMMSLNRIISTSEIHVAYGYSLVLFHAYIVRQIEE
jgi:hypothetical protein